MVAPGCPLPGHDVNVTFFLAQLGGSSWMDEVFATSVFLVGFFVLIGGVVIRGSYFERDVHVQKWRQL